MRVNGRNRLGTLEPVVTKPIVENCLGEPFIENVTFEDIDRVLQAVQTRLAVPNKYKATEGRSGPVSVAYQLTRTLWYGVKVAVDPTPGASCCGHHFRIAPDLDDYEMARLSRLHQVKGQPGYVLTYWYGDKHIGRKIALAGEAHQALAKRGVPLRPFHYPTVVYRRPKVKFSSLAV